MTRIQSSENKVVSHNAPCLLSTKISLKALGEGILCILMPPDFLSGMVIFILGFTGG